MIPGFACGSLIMSSEEPGAYAYRTSIVDPSDQTTYSGGVWNSIAIGDAHDERYVILAIVGGNSTRTVSSCTIGGVAASIVSDGTTTAQSANGGYTLEFWKALVPTGTTANISITWSGSQLRTGASVWTSTRLTSAVATDVDKSTAASGANVTLTTPANGLILAVAASGNSSAYGWTNVSERSDALIESTTTLSSADAATAGASVTPTATWSGTGTGRSLVAVSFGLKSGTASVNPPRIIDGYSNVTGAWSMSRQLLTSFGGGAKYTTDTGIDRIYDQNGGVKHLDNITDANQPTITSAGPNSRTAARFDGVSDFLTEGLGNLITAPTGYIIGCAILKAVTTNALAPEDNDGIFAADSKGFGFMFKNNSASYSWLVYNQDAGGRDTVGASITSPVDQVIVCEWRHESGTLYGRLTMQGNSPGAWQSVASGNTVCVFLSTASYRH